MLGIVKIGFKLYGEVSGFEYSFVDYVIKGYYGQDHVQVAALIQLAVDIMQDQHPSAKSSSFSQIMKMVLPHKN